MNTELDQQIIDGNLSTEEIIHRIAAGLPDIQAQALVGVALILAGLKSQLTKALEVVAGR